MSLHRVKLLLMEVSMLDGFSRFPNWLLEMEIYKDLQASSLYLYLLGKASRKERDVIFRVGNAPIHLKPGEAVVGRSSLSKATGMTEQNVRSALKRLKKMGAISITSTKSYSVVSLLNTDYCVDTVPCTEPTVQPLANVDIEDSGSDRPNSEYATCSYSRRA